MLDNIYKDLYNDLILYAYGENNINSISIFDENNENDYYSMDLENLNYRLITDDKNIFFKFENKDYENAKFIFIKIQSSYEETLTIVTNFYADTFIFPSIQIYSYQLVYLNEIKSFSINVDNNSDKKYRILINNTFGDGEIKKETNSTALNNYNSFSGNRIISFLISNETKNITIFNKNYKKSPLVFNIKVVYELNNQILEELYFNNVYDGITKTTPIKYYLKEIEYEGADINFYFKNLNLKKDDIIIRGYILKYDIMKLIADKTFIQLDFGEEIEGKFDNRTNIGLMVFDIGNDSVHYDYYYLIEISSKNKNLSEITLDIFATSKNASQFSMPINKYISGSFNLELMNHPIQEQRYYIYDSQNSSSDEYIIEFSSNYKNIDIVFGDCINETNTNIANGGIKKYFVKIDRNNNKTCNYFDVRINKDTDKMKGNYCKSANYLIRYYQSNVKLINYTVCLNGVIANENNNQKLTIKNDKYHKIDGDYNITCIYNIYERGRLLEDESINTIALTDSENIYLKTEYYKEPFNETSFILSNKINAEEYIGTVFIILKNNSDEGQISYYLFEFNITDEDKEKEEKEKKDKEKKEKEKKEENKKKNKFVGLIISIFFVVTIIVVIIGFIKYRKMKDKNKDLEQKVNKISYSKEDIPKDEDETSVIFV